MKAHRCPRSAQLKQSHLKRVKTQCLLALHKRLFSGCADGGERSLCYISAGVTLSPGETPDFSIKSQRAGHSASPRQSGERALCGV